MLREKIVNVAAAVALVLAPASAFAWNSSTSSGDDTPGHAMQENGAKPGHPGASGYAPGHQSQQFSSRDTGTATGTGLDQDRTSERSVTTRTDNGTGTTSRTYELHTTTR